MVAGKTMGAKTITILILALDMKEKNMNKNENNCTTITATKIMKLACDIQHTFSARYYQFNNTVQIAYIQYIFRGHLTGSKLTDSLE